MVKADLELASQERTLRHANQTVHFKGVGNT